MALAQLPASKHGFRLYGASNHSETDVLLGLVQEDYSTPELWAALLDDPVPRNSGGNAVSWVYSACTSSLHALMFAVLDCNDGKCEDAVVLGVDALSSIGVVGFWRARGASSSVCSPFEKGRDGILVGEGAAALRLTTHDILPGSIRILAFGMTCDAGHPTEPDPSGTWLEAAIVSAIKRAGIHINDVVAVVSHGTGTVKNDAAEAHVFRKLWPNQNIPITSIKGALGHTMALLGFLTSLLLLRLAGAVSCRRQLAPVGNSLRG